MLESNTYVLNGIEFFSDQTKRIPPSEFLVIKFGKTEYTKNNELGEYELTDVDADKIIAEFKKKNRDLVIDYEHQSISGNQAPAAGWISDLVKTSDGIVAKVKYWVEDARKLLESGAYRYLSPILYMSRRTPVALHSVAITNNPATISCPALVTSEGLTDVNASHTIEISVDETILINKQEVNELTIQRDKLRKIQMEKIKEIAEALGVSVIELADKQMDEVKTVEAINAKIVEFKEAVATLSKEKTELLTLHEVADFGALTLKIKGLVPASDLAVLTDKLATIDAEKSVAKAFSDKKLVEAQREWAMSYAKTSPEGFKAFCEKCPAVAPAPAKEVDVAKVVETSEVLEMTDESLGKKFDSDETVRNEFMDKASYVAFMKADSKGQIKICNGAVVE